MSTFCEGGTTLTPTENIEDVIVQQFACNSSTEALPAVDTNNTISLSEARQFNTCTSTTPGVCQSRVL